MPIELSQIISIYVPQELGDFDLRSTFYYTTQRHMGICLVVFEDFWIPRMALEDSQFNQGFRVIEIV